MATYFGKIHVLTEVRRITMPFFQTGSSGDTGFVQLLQAPQKGYLVPFDDIILYATGNSGLASSTATVEARINGQLYASVTDVGTGPRTAVFVVPKLTIICWDNGWFEYRLLVTGASSQNRYVSSSGGIARLRLGVYEVLA